MSLQKKNYYWYIIIPTIGPFSIINFDTMYGKKLKKKTMHDLNSQLIFISPVSWVN